MRNKNPAQSYRRMVSAYIPSVCSKDKTLSEGIPPIFVHALPTHYAEPFCASGRLASRLRVQPESTCYQIAKRKMDNPLGTNYDILSITYLCKALGSVPYLVFSITGVTRIILFPKAFVKYPACS